MDGSIVSWRDIEGTKSGYSYNGQEGVESYEHPRPEWKWSLKEEHDINIESRNVDFL